MQQQNVTRHLIITKGTEASFNTTTGPTEMSGGQGINSDTVTSIVVIIIGVVAVFMNGLLLIAMVKNKRSLFTCNGIYLIANLTAADLLTGLNAIRWGWGALGRMPQLLDTILNSIFWATVEASLLTTFVMSVERYIAIVYPFKATVCLTRRRTLQSILVIWIIASICGLFYDFHSDFVMFTLSILFEITVLVTILLYAKIFVKLAERKEILKSQLTLTSQDSRIPVDKDLQREARLTHVVLALTLIMIVTFLPYMLAGQIYIAFKHFSNDNDTSDVLLFVRSYFPIELANFVLNPFVYALRLPKYRRALLRTLKCHSQKASRQASFSSEFRKYEPSSVKERLEDKLSMAPRDETKNGKAGLMLDE